MAWTSAGVFVVDSFRGNPMRVFDHPEVTGVGQFHRAGRQSGGQQADRVRVAELITPRYDTHPRRGDSVEVGSPFDADTVR